MNNYEYLLSNISILKGVGKSLVSKFKRKKKDYNKGKIYPLW